MPPTTTPKAPTPRTTPKAPSIVALVAGPVLALVVALGALAWLAVTARPRPAAARSAGTVVSVAGGGAAGDLAASQRPDFTDVAAIAVRARSSTVKITGQRCGTTVDGSGFIADAELVLTAAHVVRGVDAPVVVDDDGAHRATTVLVDTGRDVAALRVTGLAGPPLRLLATAADGTAASIVGYPDGGRLDARPASLVREEPTVPRSIGLAGETPEPVWLIRGSVRAGDSGGPLVRPDGAVAAMVVARSTTTPDLGYAVGAARLAPAISRARDRVEPVDPGPC